VKAWGEDVEGDVEGEACRMRRKATHEGDGDRRLPLAAAVDEDGHVDAADDGSASDEDRGEEEEGEEEELGRAASIKARGGEV